MKHNNLRSALKIDFSENSALKETLFAGLMQRPDLPFDTSEDVSMVRSNKYSTSALVCVLIAVLLISGVMLAAIKSLSLGLFATNPQSDNVPMSPETPDGISSTQISKD